MAMVYVIGNGHGVDTLGKMSPDGSLHEWKYTREIAKRVVSTLTMKGYKAILLVPEDGDVPLSTRTKRVNQIVAQYGSKNVIYISIHCNAAAADGKWHDASGFSAWVSTNASKTSQDIAARFQINAERMGLKGNRYVPACKYFSANFYVLRNTNCPAVLTENLFQDNKKDVEFLLSEKGKQTIVDLHVNTLLEFV